jgi:hypothetical protein
LRNENGEIAPPREYEIIFERNFSVSVVPSKEEEKVF